MDDLIKLFVGLWDTVKTAHPLVQLLYVGGVVSFLIKGIRSKFFKSKKPISIHDGCIERKTAISHDIMAAQMDNLDQYLIDVKRLFSEYVRKIMDNSEKSQNLDSAKSYEIIINWAIEYVMKKRIRHFYGQNHFDEMGREEFSLLAMDRINTAIKDGFEDIQTRWLTMMLPSWKEYQENLEFLKGEIRLILIKAFDAARKITFDVLRERKEQMELALKVSK